MTRLLTLPHCPALMCSLSQHKAVDTHDTLQDPIPHWSELKCPHLSLVM